MGWRDLILNNFWWKLSALILATGVWYTFRTGENAEVQATASLFPSTRLFVGMPVEVLKSAQDLRNFRVAPAEVDVTLSGDYQKLKNLSSTNVHVFVAVTGAWTNSVTTNRVQIKTIPGVTLEKSNPEEVRLELLEQGSKIEFRGPDGKRHVTNVFEFERLPIRLVLPPGEQKKFQIVPEEVNVEVSGDAAKLEKVSAKDILAFVNLTGADEEPTNRPVQIYAPDGVKLEKTIPKTVRIVPVQ